MTEAAMLEASEDTSGSLAGLRQLGFGFHLDHFGTSYSELDYLRRAGATTLKIDRAFVAGIAGNRDNAELVHAMISLARPLGIAVIAQGVETAEDMAMLRAATCDYGQGNYFSRPLAVREATAFIEASPRGRNHARRP